MSKLRVVLALEGLPELLRDIVRARLAQAPEIEVREGAVADALSGADALLGSGLSDPGGLLRRGALRRVVDLDRDGRCAALYWLEPGSLRVADLSVDTLVALLQGRTAEVAPRRRHWFARRRQLADGVAAALPGPSDTLPALIRAELGRLAARLLQQRPRVAATAGPAGALDALLRELAVAAEYAAPLPGLVRLGDRFGLVAAERDLLFLSAAVMVDGRASRLVGLLNDHLRRPWPTPGLLAGLGHDVLAVVARLAGDGPLLGYDLVSLEGAGPLVEQGVIVQPTVWPLVFDTERQTPYEQARVCADNLDALALPAHQRAAIAASALRLAANTEPPLLAVVGQPGTGRHALARAIAGHWRAEALLVRAAQVDSSAAVAAIAREAMLAAATVVLSAPEGLDPRQWRALTGRPGIPLILVTTPAQVGRLALDAARPLVEVAAPPRDLAWRRRLWGAILPGDWPPAATDDLAGRFDLGDADMRGALRQASAQADADGRQAPTPSDLRQACERLAEVRFDGAAERLDCPFGLDDIVLQPKTRRELDLAITWARHGPRLFDPAGPAAALHAGSGLACLFSGPPGTGKTMAARIVAREIDCGLYRVDLAQVVDKFIGESEKRLAALFDAAERARVVLFFDEADALFGRRTEVRDAHDRYANITVDYLLMRLEGFSGLAILATNLAGNIDDAFLRRVRVRAEFSAPDAAERARIWDKLLPAPPERAADIDVALLAETYELVGGEIRNAIYTAHLLAAAAHEGPSMRHCVAGLWREIGKTGRIADPAALGSWRPAIRD